jgi:hypothetical protein
VAEGSFKPIRIVDVELTEPLPSIQHLNQSTGQPYGGVFCLVRHQGSPSISSNFRSMGRTSRQKNFKSD